MVNGPGHRCTVCFKCYKRPEHLRRHYASHSVDRPHQCQRCDSTFQRADVLKRHLKTCDGKRSTAASKRRACDHCVRQKKACNSRQPCDHCLKKHVPCYYSLGSNLDASAAISQEFMPGSADLGLTCEDPILSTLAEVPHGLDDWSFEDLPTSTFNAGSAPVFADFSDIDWRDIFAMEEDILPPEPLVSHLENRKCFQFLDRFTSRTGLVSSFECGTLRQRQQVVAKFTADQEPMGIHAQPLWSNAPREQLVSGSGASPANPATEAVSNGGPLTLDPLQWQTHQIILLVKEVITVKARNSAVTLTWSSALEQMCLQFFSPPNLRKYLELYWAIWHPNVNFVHRPTFDAETCKPALLASMALIGRSAIS